MGTKGLITEDAKPADSGRLTKQQVLDHIKTEYYWQIPDTNILICAIVLINDLFVIGYSICEDRSKFDIDESRKIARRCAVEEIWALLKYPKRHYLNTY